MNDYNQFQFPKTHPENSIPQYDNINYNKITRKIKHTSFKKTTAIILLIVIVVTFIACFIKDIVVNPLKELTYITDITHSCRIKLVEKSKYASSSAIAKIKEKSFSIKINGSHPKYFEFQNNTVYQLHKNPNGEIEKEEYTPDRSNSRTINAILDYNNYERRPGKLFSWRLKEGVDVGDLYNVSLERKMGKITITAYYNYTDPGTFNKTSAKVTFTFDRFIIIAKPSP